MVFQSYLAFVLAPAPPPSVPLGKGIKAGVIASYERKLDDDEP
jgi:hypothetical protein